MSRYIDADKLRKDEIARCHCVPCVGSCDNNWKDLDEVLNDAPTADVVEVVRCKDCIHAQNMPLGLCYLHTEPYDNAKGYKGDAVCVEPDDFCSYGERRKENEA